MRRSSRQQPPLPTGSTSTSGPSSTASARLERSTRSNNKQSSPQKSATPPSTLLWDSNDTEHGGARERSKRDPPSTRKSDKPDGAKVAGDSPDVNDPFDEDEEVTRCLCGQMEYPGPPEVRSKSNHPALEAQSDDAGSLFIQCDVCKVWQHGGCVGIMDEAAVDDYFCERCRPEYHEVSAAKNGQRYSLYLPVHDKASARASHRKSSASREADARAAKEREKAVRAEALAKRRSTMNSRSAYDEEEVLRAVLEQSKNEGGTASSDGTRRGKRGRDDSDDASKDVKRQRTASELSSDNEESGSPPAESDNEAKGLKQRPRGGTNARSQREKEQREKERAEAANKRKGRADRRRGEDSEPPDNAVRASTAPSDVDASASQPPDTPQLGPTGARSHKKGAKAPAKRGKNQWTRENTQTPLEADVPTANGERRSRRGAGDEASPPRTTRNGDNVDGGGGGNKEPADADAPTPTAPLLQKGHGRVKGSKQPNIRKISMNDIRKKVNLMLQRVSSTQIDIAGKRSYQLAVHSALRGVKERPEDEAEAQSDSVNEGKKENQQQQQAAGPASNSSGSTTRGFPMPLEDFEKLPHTEMANMLSTQLILWQQEFGKPGEK